MTRPEDRKHHGGKAHPRRSRAHTRTPVIIDAVANDAAADAPVQGPDRPVDLDELAAARLAKASRAPVKEAKPSRLGVARAKAHEVLPFADRHAFTVASLTLSLGIGWLIGANTFGDNASMGRLAAGLEKVGTRVETLAARIPAAQQDSQDLAALKQEVRSLKTALDVTRVRTADAVGQVKERIARAQSDSAPRLDAALQRLDRIEQRFDREAAANGLQAPAPLAAMTTFRPVPAQRVTVDLRHAPHSPEATPSSSLPDLLPASARAAIPPRGYILRTVLNGIAYVETRDGIRTAEPGQTLPGAGRVRSIEKRGAKWVVVTSNGVIDSDLY